MSINEIIKIANTGLFGLIVGALISILLHYANRKRKILVYSYKTQILIRGFRNEVDGLEITYNGDPIKNLATTNIGIWNKGRDPIRREDIAPREPVAIHFREEIIGDPIILFSKTPASYVSVNKENRKIIIDFDFLDFEDGAVIQVFHTSKLILDLGSNPQELIATMNEDVNSFDGYFEDSADQSINSKEELAGIFNDEEYYIRGKDFQPFFVTGKVIGVQEGIKLHHSASSVEIDALTRFVLPILFVFMFLLTTRFTDAVKTVVSEASAITNNPLFAEILIPILMALISLLLSLIAVLLVGKRFVLTRVRNPRVVDKI